MQSFEAIQHHIQRARIERAVVLAGLVSGAIIATWNAVKFVADHIVRAERAKDPDKAFTFEA
jgi:hypothetical protein